MIIVSQPPSGAVMLRQRIVKSGSYTASRNSRERVPGWVADSTWPGTVSADGLRVAGSGACTIDASISRSASTDSMTIYVMLSGVEVTSFSVSSSGSTTWTGTVTDGDIITLEVEASGTTTARRTITDGWIDLTPA